MEGTNGGDPKYGSLSPTVGSLPGLSLYTATWNRDANRVVVWFQIEGHLEEYVTYFDPHWFRKLEKAVKGLDVASRNSP